MSELISLKEQKKARELISIPSGQGAQKAPTAREISRDSAFYSYATGRPLEETSTYVEKGWTPNLQQESTLRGQEARTQQVEGFLDLDDKEANAAIEDVVADLRSVEMFSRFLPDSMTAALKANATGSREMLLDRISRLVLTGEKIQERVDAMGSLGNYVKGGAEMLLDPFSLIHQNKYQELTKRYEGLLAPGVSPLDFEQGLEEILTEAADAGFFTEENPFYFATFLDTLGSGIYSNKEQAETVLNWLDFGLTAGAPAVAAIRSGRQLVGATAALGGSTALTAGVLARNAASGIIDGGRDYLSALNIMTPSKKSEAIIEEVLSRHITLDSAEGMTPTAHTHTSIMTPTTVRAGHLTAPEHTAARNFELNSEGLAELREIAEASGRVFDQETIETFTDLYKKDRIAHLRDTGEMRVIDVDVAVDEFNNIYFTDILGTTRGKGYATETSARRAAGYGEEVAQLHNGDWVVVRRGNIPLANAEKLEELGYTQDLKGLMLYRATDPDNLGYGFWAQWGSPLAQADPLTSSNLFRGEGVMQRAMHQINSRTKTISRSMSRTQVSEVYQAFKHMASSQNRNAMDRDEFVGWFSSTFGREPTRNQEALYLLQQERLDAELFITANEQFTQAVNMGANTARIDGEEYVSTRVDRDSLDANVYVFDADRGEAVSIREINGDLPIFRNVGSKELPADVQYFTGSNVESRAVRHSDFLSRNSGGHRGYIVNEMQFLVKQESVHTYLDGTTRQTSPNTLLGARTRQEADAAVKDINTIMDELHRVVPTTGRTADGYLDALEGAINNSRLNDIVRANSGFNPIDINGLESLIKFARDRGLDLRTPFRVVGEGDALGDMARIKDNATLNPNRTHGDDLRMNITRGGRGTLPLTRYGGGQITERSTQDVLEGAYASTIARMTEAAYRIRAGKGLIRGAIDSGVMKAEFNQYRNAPLRTQLEAIKKENLIDTSGATGKDALTGRKFQLDLDRLLFRMQQQSFTARKWNDITRNLSNHFYGKNWGWATSKMDRWSTDPSTALRGWAFDAYLGMFNVSQLLMQSVQVVNIVGIAGTKAMIGGALYGPMRFALNNQNPQVTKRFVDLLHRTVGLDREQFEDMVKLFRETGRGIVDNNVAEMTMAEDAGSSIGKSQTVRSAREAGRVFFKEGDLVARITAFNTAYLEAVEKFGKRTVKNKTRFNQWVDWRQQVLTQGMTAASRQGYEQLPFMQFMSYQLRINEALFAGTFSNTKSVLTNAEKWKLATTHLAMFGAMGTTVTGVLSQYAEANYSLDAPEWVIRLAQRGLLDSILSELTGVDSAASSRFASSMGMYQTLESLSRNHPAVFLVGPSGQFAGALADTTIGVLYQGIRAAVTGNTQDLRVEVTDFARLFSSGNYTYNAITAYRYGRYLTKKGGLVSDDLDAMDAAFLAFGIPIEEIESIYSYLGQRKITTFWLRQHANSITSMHNRAHEALRKGDHEGYLHFMSSVGEARQMLEPWEREQVDRMIRDEERSLTDGFIVELFRRDVAAKDQVR